MSKAAEVKKEYEIDGQNIVVTAKGSHDLKIFDYVVACDTPIEPLGLAYVHVMLASEICESLDLKLQDLLDSYAVEEVEALGSGGLH